jgi:hypothetical protein
LYSQQIPFTFSFYSTSSINSDTNPNPFITLISPNFAYYNDYPINLDGDADGEINFLSLIPPVSSESYHKLPYLLGVFYSSLLGYTDLPSLNTSSSSSIFCNYYYY